MSEPTKPFEFEPEPRDLPLGKPKGQIPQKIKVIAASVAAGVILCFLVYSSCNRPPMQTRRTSVVHQTLLDPTEAAKRKAAEEQEKDYERRAAARNAEEAKRRVAWEDSGDGHQQAATGYAAPTPQKTAKQQAAEEFEKRLHDAAYSIALVTERKSNAISRSSDQSILDPISVSSDSRDGSKSSGDHPVDIRASGVQLLPEGTIISAETVNMLEGSNTSPVLAMVTRDVYAPATRIVVIPQGARFLGTASKVAIQNQDRLAIAFHRLQLDPQGTHTVDLDKFPALDQQGATGLHDKVNNHYAQIFGVSMAVGALGGLAQIGSGSYGGLQGYDASQQFRQGITNSMSTSSSQILNRFLTRLPTVTIRPGTRMAIILTSDLKIPVYE